MQELEVENIGSAPAHPRREVEADVVRRTFGHHRAIEVTAETYIPADACTPVELNADRAAASAVQEIGKDMSERAVVGENPLPSLLEQEKLK